MNATDSVARILADARAVKESGGRLGKDFDRLAAAWLSLTDPDQSAGEKLAAAIVSGADEGEVGALWTAALVVASSTPRAIADARGDVANALTPALHAALTEHAADNYRSAAKAYTTAGAALAAALASVAADADPTSLVDEPERLRTWGTIPALAADLYEAHERVKVAARVAGVPMQPERIIALALSVPPGTKRRDVWAVWEDHDHPGRAGRWGALVALGCELVAPDLDEVNAYRRPEPLREEWRREGFGHGRHIVDPEEEREAAELAAAAGAPMTQMKGPRAPREREREPLTP